MPKAKKQTVISRPPIVTIMGHVDHGKTTLLDALRKSRLVEREHGGITQHIAAYQLQHQDQKITFIDTPGHAAFSKMRQRGATITDIVILVVAADDGVKPQTVESIKHIRAANVPVIVAINKMDLPGASPEMVKAQLTEHEIFVEGYGGQTPAVEISAIKQEGLTDLLEMIILVSQLEDLPADPKADLSAVIIESHLDKRRGPMVTVIVRQGTLNLSDTVYTGMDRHNIRALFNDLGQRVPSVGPGDPVLIMGLGGVPQVGSIITGKPQPADIKPPEPTEPADPPETETSDTLDTKEETTEPVEEREERPAFNLVLKADTAGTLEAVIQNALHDEVTLIKSGVGPITGSDVLLAQSTNALIIGFNVPVTGSAKKLARLEKVAIKQFDIIYKLIEFLEEKILTMIEPTINEEELGSADIVAIFDIKDEHIAGCQVGSGKIDRQFPVHLVRNDKIIADAKIASLKQGKEVVKVVKAGQECGIVLKPSLDFKKGDVIKSYRTLEE